MNQRRVVLDCDQTAALTRLRDTSVKPYLRERASAILKIADGLSAKVVARERLLRARRPETVCDWLDRFQAGGLSQLGIKAGRGRKPVFSPSDRDV